MSTTVSVDELAMRTEDTIPFDQYGRYLIVPEGGTKPVGHTRVTTFAATLDDRYGLERWGLRMSALGFVARNDLYAKLVGTRPDDKHALDKLCAEAKEAAAASAGANMGTALHAMCERVDLGEDIIYPPPFDADVKAYTKALNDHGVVIIPDMVERYVVLPDLQLGGKLDRLVDFGATPKIMDLKTGGSLEFSWAAISVQLACYANAKTLYNGRTKTHTPMPEVDKDVALVAHLPAGQARCDLYWVDIKSGWEAAGHAKWVRDWRKRKDLAELWRDDLPLAVTDVRRQRLLARVKALAAIPDALKLLASSWPTGIPTFKQSDSHTDEQLDLIAMTLSIIEAQHNLPFTDPDPATSI